MARFALNRRRFLTSAGVGASGLLLSGCDAFDGFAGRTVPCAASSPAPTG